MPALAPFFEAVRSAAPKPLWSLGVKIAREQGVVCEKRTPSEILLRVATEGRALSATVQLWPEDEDWHCDCGRATAACEHVAASVIALRRAEEQGQEIPSASSLAVRLNYHFKRHLESLVLEREFESGEQIFPVVRSLHTTSRENGLPFSPSKADVTVDSLVGETVGRVLPASKMDQVLRLLQDTPYAFLDNRPIEVCRAVPPYQVVLEDRGDSEVHLFLEKIVGVEEVFSNGAALFEGKLCPADEPDFTLAEKELWRGKVFSPPQFTDLVSRLLPALKAKIKVQIRTRRLPLDRAEDLPRLVVHTSGSREGMSVLPLIVYGDPPYARVDGGALTLLGDSQRVPERDVALEQRIAGNFRSQMGLSVGRRADFVGETAIGIAERLEALKLPVVGDVLAAFRRKPPLEAEFSVNGDQFEVRFRTADGEGVDTERVFRAWQEGNMRIPLLGGGWAPIPQAWLEQHGHTVLDLIEARNPQGHLPAFARPELARLCEALDTPCDPDLSTLRNSVEGFDRIPEAALPSDLTATLRPYQKHGVDWLCFLKAHEMGALLADDMGLGKTLQTLCVLERPSLIVAPTSVLPNWQKEIARFRPGLRVQVFHGSERELDAGADITLTSYALLRRDAALLGAVDWDSVVLDEAQNIKNAESQSAQSAFALKARFRVALTGTPVENRAEDLWSLFHFLNPGLLGGRSRFSERLEALLPKIKPFVLRRLKREVAPELPARTELVLYCELEEEERAIYTAVLAATRKEVVEKIQGGKGVLAALEALLRLRQAACHPGLLPGKSRADSSKLRLLREKLEESVGEGHKALVFSQWTGLLDLLEPGLQASNLDFCRIDGSTPAEKRASIVEQFQSPDGPPLLLMTLKAGGVGLNLTAADHVFLIDPWWNPAAEDQAADRAHRIGQDRPVFIHRLVSRDTVEEKILALQEAKRQIAAGALSGTAAAGLTKDDLIALLG